MKKKIIKFSVLSLIIFIILVFYISLNKSPLYDTKNLIGTKISNINLESFDGKKTITIEDLKKNNFTLINFWASWCSPCRQEHPFLLKLKKEKNLKIIGVNFKDKKDHAITFLNNLGNPYHYLAKDKLGKQSIFFGVYGIPESILISSDLVIKKKFLGPISEEDYKKIKDMIKSQ